MKAIHPLIKAIHLLLKTILNHPLMADENMERTLLCHIIISARWAELVFIAICRSFSCDDYSALPRPQATCGSYMTHHELTTCASNWLSLKSSVTKAGAGKDAGEGEGEGEEEKARYTDDEEKFAELELRSLHLQQNVEITETNLVARAVIQHSTGCWVSGFSPALAMTSRWLE